MSYGLVIFDCDGVLVDTERLTVAVEARVLTEMGWLHTPADVVDRFMGRTSEAMLAEIEAELGADATQRFDELTTLEIDEIFERELVAVAGVEAVLDALSQRDISTCVASSGSHQKMRRTLGMTGLYDRFRGRIFSASEVAHGKPAPDLFLHAATEMGSRAASTAVVEDSVYGVQAAVAAGMTAYGFAGGLCPADTLAGAGAVVFHEMAELVALLDHSSFSIA